VGVLVDAQLFGQRVVGQDNSLVLRQLRQIAEDVFWRNRDGSVVVEFGQPWRGYLVSPQADVFLPEEELCRQVGDLDRRWVVERNGLDTGKTDVFSCSGSESCIL
jgi:hypothetical protein